MPIVKRVKPGDRPSAERQNIIGDLLNQRDTAGNAIVDDIGISSRAGLLGGGSANNIVRFEVTAAGPYLGDITPECDYVRAEVLAVSCQNSGVSVGDEINVWDIGRCKFNIPAEVLIGSQGWAVKMVNPSAVTGSGTGWECVDEQAAEGSCRWEVQCLCCVEELYGG